MNGLALCAGVAGLELGIAAVVPDYRTVCLVEGEAYAAATLARRMADGCLEPAPIYSDLRSFDGAEWRGLVDILTAGYPCQPFSTAGKRLGEDDPRHLWPDVRRVIAETGAPLVCCENVAAHLSLGFDVVASDMARMGYRVAAGVFSAAAVGAPHQRDRLFWVGVADADGESIWQQPERGPSAARSPEPRNDGARDEGQAGVAPDADGHGLGQRPQRNGEPNRGEQAPRRNDALRLGGDAADADGEHLRHPERSEGFASIGKATRWSGANREPGNTSPWDRRQAPSPICGVDDGVAHRVDRLRACGNGVVPAVAARAFVTLLRELIEVME